MDKVAVVILNWNGEAMLRQFLPSVLAHSQTTFKTSVYLADNGSTDNSISVTQLEFPAVKLVDLGENYGFAEGYNRAIDQIEAEYIVLLNSDVEVSANWLEPLVQYMDANPKVGACQPKIRDWKNKDHFEYAGASGGFIDKYGYPFCRGRIQNTLELDKGQYDDIKPIFWASGAALFIRKQVYQQVGGLDARFFAHMEEIDLCWRIGSRGYSLAVVPQSVVYHVGGATLNKSNPRKTFLNFRNNLLMLYKNLPEAELKKTLRTRYLLDNLAMLFFLICGELGNAKAVIRARREFKKLKSEFDDARAENLKHTSPNLNGIYKHSIIFDYYIRGIKKFSLLKLK